MAVTFIGDVHGWSDRLRRVVEAAAGELVLMGDLIDRGPDAPGTISFVRQLCAEGRARCVLGNHEYALLRGLGAPTIGLAPDPRWFSAWRERYGGQAVMTAYAADDAAQLTARMGPDRDFLASLPWVASGSHDGLRWVAVHAGLDPDLPWLDQVEALALGWTTANLDAPRALFEKPWARSIPADLPGDVCIVSGHTPLPRPFISPQRILCDTSGGMPGRQLCGVVWPAGRAVFG